MSDVLAELERELAALSPAALADIDKLLEPELSKPWLPQPGPQTMALTSLADILLFGGQAGGGKTALVLGLAFTEHRRSLIMRRQYTDLRAITDEAIKLNGTRDGFNGSSPPRLVTRGGRLIDFGAASRAGDEASFQGNPHDLLCVGRGTPILMADGTYKAVEAINVGDLVATLEGPRPVTKTFPIQRKSAVRLTAFDADGQVAGSQIQSVDHALLTSAGWAPLGSGDAPRQRASYAANGCQACRIVGGQFAETSARPSHNLGGLRSGLRQIASQFLSRLVLVHPFALGIFAFGVREFLGNGSVAFDGSNLDDRPPVLSTDLLGHRPRPLLSGALGHTFSHSSVSYGERDAPRMSLPLGLEGHCSAGSHLCGGRTRAFSDRRSAPEGAQLYLRQSGDAGRSSPIGWPPDDGGQTPKCTFRIGEYDHPYRKGARPTNESFAAASAFSVEPLGVTELFDLEVADANHYISAGGFINKNCFDEAAHFLESQVQFLMGWLRSTEPGQRCRVVLASNPPMASEGEWLVEWFAPWLDPMHHLYPTPPGELRWCVITGDNRIVWVDGPGEHTIEGERDILIAQSRTFIPSRLTDNAYLPKDYRAQLMSLPEPRRSQLLHGDFLAARQDHEWQVVPSEWVKIAQDKWKRGKPEKQKMSALGVDPSLGGADDTVIAPLYGTWFDTLRKHKGVKIRSGADVGALIVKELRDGAAINIDMTGGWGDGARVHLESNKIRCNGIVFSGESFAQNKSGTYGFINKRAELWWLFREALDPEAGHDVALPPDKRLFAQLTAPRYTYRGSDIKIESKEDIKERLGSSTDDADAVILAWHVRSLAAGQYRRKSKTKRGSWLAA